MDDLNIKLQVYLMKKDNECGKLRFLTSRTTSENSAHIQDVCDSIGEILYACNIPIQEDTSMTDPRCVHAYKYLLLNTFFESQEHLAEDLVNGHLVDMCPPLSPYLLMEILWSLKYESIAAESLLHLPLDLCVEIIEITRRCLGLLDFERRLELLSTMILNCRKKLHIIAKTGAQTTNLDESLELLFTNFQELLALFSDAKFTRLDEVLGCKKSERQGLILKRALSLMKNCLESGSGVVRVSAEMETMYKITFGRTPVRSPSEKFGNQLRIIDQEFVHLSLKVLEDITCRTYIDWASYEADGNSTISLQRSIGIECYHLIEFMKSYDYLLQYDHLIEVLQQLSSKPPTEASGDELSIDELRKGASEGNEKCIKALMNRYSEWNHEIFNVIRQNKSTMDKDDFMNLLEYLTLVMTKPGQEEHKRIVYATVTRVLMRQDIPDLYQTTLEYILKHDGRNTLESTHTEESFKKFMAHNKNFKSPSNLRVLLLFMMKNPRKILTILVRMAIGDDEYENVMISPEDLCLLSPIMNVREKSDETLFVGALRSVCTTSAEWNAKKFAHLVEVAMNNGVLSADKIVNAVLIACLADKGIGMSKLRSILNCTRKIAPACTKETDSAGLLEALVGKMSSVRNDVRLPKYSANEALSMITRVVEIFLRKLDDWLDTDERTALVERVNAILEPIDKHHFARLLSTDFQANIDVFDTLMDYERRCLVAMKRVEASRKTIDNDDEREITLNDFRRFDQDFLRYLIVKSTETEYVRLAAQATLFHAEDFRCKVEYDCYEKIVSVTVEACVYCLEFPARNPPDSFACLLKGLAQFTRGITSLERVRNIERIYESLADNVRVLDSFVRNTIFSSLCTPVVLLINNRASHEPVHESLRELTRAIEDFGNKCLEIPHKDVHFDRANSSEALSYKIAHDFIAGCMSVNDDGSYQSLCNVYKSLCSRETPAHDRRM